MKFNAVAGNCTLARAQVSINLIDAVELLALVKQHASPEVNLKVYSGVAFLISGQIFMNRISRLTAMENSPYHK